MRADQVAFEYGVYDVAQPSSDLAADFAEQLWRNYEGRLPSAVKALDDGSWTRDHWSTVLLHVQAQSIRHPDFDRAARDYIRSMGDPEPSKDDVQAQRQRTYRSTRDWMAQARFAIVRQCYPAARFLVNDKGYVPLEDPVRQLRGVLFPLSGLVGVMMVVNTAETADDYESGPLAERILSPNAVAIVNEATLDTTGIRCVIGHPDDWDIISAIPIGPKAVQMPENGPYLGTFEEGVFDWARPVRKFAIGP